MIFFSRFLAKIPILRVTSWSMDWAQIAPTPDFSRFFFRFQIITSGLKTNLSGVLFGAKHTVTVTVWRGDFCRYPLFPQNGPLNTNDSWAFSWSALSDPNSGAQGPRFYTKRPSFAILDPFVTEKRMVLCSLYTRSRFFVFPNPI